MRKLSTVSGETIKCYHASAKHMIVPWLMTALLFFVGMSIYYLFIYPQGRKSEGVPFFDVIMLGLVALIACGIIASLWAETKGTFLYVSDGGIEYIAGWHQVYIPWENVQELHAQGAPYLLLKQSALPEWRLILNRDPLAGRMIPLSGFNFLENAELKQDLRRYAPHLFA